jgi:hypothetical protein
MGSSSSIINKDIELTGRVFKTLQCECICSLVYTNYCVQDIELLVPCWNCIESLKEKKYESKEISKLFKNSLNANVYDLIGYDTPNRWLTESEAIVYALKRKIPYVELIPNDEFERDNPNVPPRDLLKRYQIYV